MKKVVKILLIVFALICTLDFTSAYFTTSKSINNTFKARKYNIVLNGNGGTYSKNNIIVLKNKTTLPSPSRNGYTFSGYSTTSTGSVNYSANINDVSAINNKTIYAKWNINNYSITYNLNGGSLSGQKTSYTIEDSYTLPTPTKNGNSFLGWTGSNGSTNQTSVTIPKGSTGNKSYTANWSTNSYYVDVNPIIDGTTYNSGLEGYTFDVWVNGTLVADDVIDWYTSVAYGSNVRVKANSLPGRNTSYDQTITVGDQDAFMGPIWTVNTYESHFYLDGVHRLTTYNKYGAYITTPSTSAAALGYDSNFYYVSGFTPWETWYQPDRAVGFTINMSEYNCTASFGSQAATNGYAQKAKLEAAGYDFCTYNSDWGALTCYANYSRAIGLYNNAWNILPKSGSGYSIYKSISCESGWANVQRR